MMVAGRELPVSAWRTLVVAVACMVILAVAGVLYTGHAIREQDRAEREQDRRWCALLVTLDDQYRAPPPTTETGRRVAAAIAFLRESFGCPPS